LALPTVPELNHLLLVCLIVADLLWGTLSRRSVGGLPGSESTSVESIGRS